MNEEDFKFSWTCFYFRGPYILVFVDSFYNLFLFSWTGYEFSWTDF